VENEERVLKVMIELNQEFFREFIMIPIKGKDGRLFELFFR
jgi:hypothetical protein